MLGAQTLGGQALGSKLAGSTPREVARTGQQRQHGRGRRDKSRHEKDIVYCASEAALDYRQDLRADRGGSGAHGLRSMAVEHEARDGRVFVDELSEPGRAVRDVIAQLGNEDGTEDCDPGRGPYLAEGRDRPGGNGRRGGLHRRCCGGSEARVDEFQTDTSDDQSRDKLG